LIVLAFVKVATKSFVKGMFQNSTKLTYKDSLNLYIESLESVQDSLNNALSGKKIDDITVVDSLRISKADTSIHYYLHITTYVKNELDIEKLDDAMKPILDSFVTNNEKMSINRRFKTKFIYSYFDKKGDFLTTIKADY
jgi:hypothetical protein